MLKEDLGSYLQVGIQKFLKKITGGPVTLSLYELWLESGGSDDFSFEEYYVILATLSKAGRCEMAAKALLRCAEVHSGAAAERLDEVARNIASQCGNSALYKRYKRTLQR